MMPWLDPKDVTISGVMERWFSTVIDELDDIRGWRDDPAEKWWHGEWKEPANLESQTAYLFAYVANHYPQLNPNPITTICEIVMAWHREKNADGIPDQGVIDDQFRRAWFIVEAVRKGIQSRVTIEPPEGGSQKAPPKLVTVQDIADMVGIERNSMAPYTKDWGNPEVKASGRRPAKFDYGKILPTLKQQFPHVVFAP